MFIPFHQYGLIHHKFRVGVNNLFYKYEKLMHGRLTVT